MSLRLLFLLAVTAGFGVLSAVAIVDAGYIGIFETSLDSWAGTQVLFDVVILAVLAIAWMYNDARHQGMNAWPFIAVTLFAGSFGPLAYLIARELRQRAPQPALA